jgi:hypothetical protein
VVGPETSPRGISVPFLRPLVDFAFNLGTRIWSVKDPPLLSVKCT